MNEEIQIGNPWALSWTGLAVLAIGLIAWTAWRRRRSQRRLASPEMLSRLLPPQARLRQWIAWTCVTLAIALLSIALADLRWGKTRKEVPQRGIEVVFLLDVSRSMLAQDTSPNRLGRAKQQIREMLGEMAGDRVALIAFAGETKQVVPLTNHYDSFKQQLDEVNITTVRRGGSKLGNALDVASDAFLDKTNAHKAIVVFTDGEDQESDPVKKAIEISTDSGIRIYPIGLGDMDQGSRIPDADPDEPGRQPGRYIKYDGEAVWSKMNGAILSQVAEVSGGVYIPAGTRRVDMRDLYRRTIGNLPQSEFDRVKIDAFAVRFQWFAIPAMLLLLIETMIQLEFFGKPKRVSKALVLLMMTSLISSSASAAELGGSGSKIDVTRLQSANTAYRENRYTDAIEQYSGLMSATDNQVAFAARHNLGTAAYQLALAASAKPETSGDAIARLDQSIGAFRLALRLDKESEDARYNLQRAVMLKNALNQQEQPPSNQQEPSEQDQSDDQQESQQEESQDQSQQNDGQQNDGQEKEDSQGDPSQTQQQDGGADQPNESDRSEESQGSEPEMQSGQPNEQDANQQGSSDRQGSGDSGDQDQEEPPGGDPNSEGSGTDHQGELSADDGEEPNDSASMNDANMQQQDQLDTETMSRQEAMKMLQAVRDRDMIRRYRQRANQRSRHVAVDKDW